VTDQARLQVALWVLAAVLLLGAACNDGDTILDPVIDCTAPGTICRPDCPDGWSWACCKKHEGPCQHPAWQESWVEVDGFCWCIPPAEQDDESDDEQTD